jgi:hypothetical protein
MSRLRNVQTNEQINVEPIVAEWVESRLVLDMGEVCDLIRNDEEMIRML